MKILIHSNASWGGIVDYMVWQANTMVKAGHEVILIVPTTFDKSVSPEVSVLRSLPDVEDRSNAPALVRKTRWIFRTLKSWKTTAKVAAEVRPDALLLSAYSEYLAPLWKRHFVHLRRKIPRLRVGAIVHDPVRLAVGPESFHKRSVRCAFEVLDAAFVHSPVELNQEGATPPVPQFVIPFGVYHFPDSETEPEDIRKKLGVPDDAVMLFAFGHIRDSKNLDLAIEMLERFPQIHMVVAGKVMSSRDRPVSHYQDLASSVGVSDRVTFLEKYLPDSEAADLFSAADFILLSYDGGFVSASSVLHVAIKFRKLCLATSGDGHLKWAVEKYDLGVWTPPDDLDSLAGGMSRLLDQKLSLSLRWNDYETENTWEENAKLIIKALQPITLK